MAKGHAFKGDMKGYKALLQSEVGLKAVEAHTQPIADRANALAAHAGAEYGAKVFPRGTRSRWKVPYGIVHTVGVDGAVDNAKNNTLAKAMGGG